MKMPPTVENHSSSLLSSDENSQIFRLLGNRCPTICTTVVQLFCTQAPHHSQWYKRDTGVLCFVKDNIRKNYFFRLFCLRRNLMLWEHEIYNNMEYIESTSYLHVFEGEDCIVAFNFASVEEARDMKMIVDQKIHMRRRREEKRARQLGQSQSMKLPNETNVYKKTLTPETKAANRRRKITKEDISIPMDFKHISHVGWNPNSGFDINSEDEQLKKFLKEAGVSEKQLQDKDTREFIYDFINKHGVREAMAEVEVTPPPAVPPRGPPRAPHARAAPPPPPGSSGSGVSNGPSRPPEPPMSRKPGPPPAPPMANNNNTVTGFAPPAPPPPPPPMGMPPSFAGDSGPEGVPMPPAPPAPAPPMVDSSALMDSIRSGTSLKPVEDRKPAPPVVVDEARGDLLSEIRKGLTLRPVNEREIKPSMPSPKNPGPGAGGNDLATALALALAERSKAIHSEDDDDASSESSNDDWED